MFFVSRQGITDLEHFGVRKALTRTERIIKHSWVLGRHPEWSFNVHSEWLTATEAAEYLKVQPRTILKWAKAGTIPAHALSGCKRVTWRFLKEEIDRAMLKPPSVAGLER